MTTSNSAGVILSPTRESVDPDGHNWNFHDDAVFTSPVAKQIGFDEDGTVNSKDALRRYWTAGLAHNPDLHVQVTRVYQGTSTLVIAFKNQKGIDRVEVLTFRHGLVIEGHGLSASGWEFSASLGVAACKRVTVPLKAMRGPQPYESEKLLPHQRDIIFPPCSTSRDAARPRLNPGRMTAGGQYRAVAVPK
jgi:hypothetical protein